MIWHSKINNHKAAIFRTGQLAIAAAMFWALAVGASQAVEPWADPKLPVKDGLELWLDGTHALGARPLKSREALNEWPDASGRGRNLRQDDKTAQPKLLNSAASALFASMASMMFSAPLSRARKWTRSPSRSLLRHARTWAFLRSPGNDSSFRSPIGMNLMPPGYCAETGG